MHIIGQVKVFGCWCATEDIFPASYIMTINIFDGSKITIGEGIRPNPDDGRFLVGFEGCC